MLALSRITGKRLTHEHLTGEDRGENQESAPNVISSGRTEGSEKGMSKGKVFDFELVPIDRITRSVGDPASDPIGSAYDPILDALKRSPGFGVKIGAEGSTPLSMLTLRDRKRIQSGLKTMANNREIKIETRVTSDAVCVWLAEQD